jgi:acyl-CoA reductase-like NAD-dependent aldehyde dehydrogenase
VTNGRKKLPTSDESAADARVRRELAAVGRSEFFEVLRYTRQQRADLLRIASDMLRAHKGAAMAAQKRARG